MKKFDNKRVRNILILSAIISFVAHLSVLPTKYSLVSQDEINKLKKKPKKIRLVFAKKKKQKNEKVKQIVSTESTKKELADDPKFFSKDNNSVKKQTKARVVDTFNKAGYGNSEVDTPVKRKVKKQSTSKKVAKKSKKAKKSNISFEDFMFTKKAMQPQRTAQLIKGQRNGSVKHKGIASNNDYLEDIPLGDMTQLNTKENKYYGFYFRIKQRLEQYWGDSLRKKLEKIYQSGGRFPASEKHLTSVKVVLDHKGRILNVLVRNSSGVKELDEAAVESFNRAGPFPNPPKGMIKNGRASIEWGFAVTNS